MSVPEGVQTIKKKKLFEDKEIPCNVAEKQLDRFLETLQIWLVVFLWSNL